MKPTRIIATGLPALVGASIILVALPAIAWADSFHDTEWVFGWMDRTADSLGATTGRGLLIGVVFADSAILAGILWLLRIEGWKIYDDGIRSVQGDPKP